MSWRGGKLFKTIWTWNSLESLWNGPKRHGNISIDEVSRSSLNSFHIYFELFCTIVTFPKQTLTFVRENCYAMWRLPSSLGNQWFNLGTWVCWNPLDSLSRRKSSEINEEVKLQTNRSVLVIINEKVFDLEKYLCIVIGGPISFFLWRISPFSMPHLRVLARGTLFILPRLPGNSESFCDL